MKYITIIEGVPGDTVRVAAHDFVQHLTDAAVGLVLTINNSPAISVLISCEEETLRYAYGVNPTQGVNQVGHLLYAGAEIVLNSGRAIREFRFINDVNAVDGFIQVTPFFKIGA